MGKYKLGIVQGRLIQAPPGNLQWFPQEHWESEFSIASAIGYDFVELIVERKHNEKNPVWSDEGISRIKELHAKAKLTLYAICNDYVIDNKLPGSSDTLKQALRVVDLADSLGIRLLVLPLFEKSEITNDNFEEYKEPLREIADYAASKSMIVCLETILDGNNLLKLFDYLDRSNIKCVFDTGNRVAFGHDICGDIKRLNKTIEHVHIKDKNEKNENVLLGTGMVNFLNVFNMLGIIGYSGALTFETSRGKDPVETARYNKYFIEFFAGEAQEQ